MLQITPDERAALQLLAEGGSRRELARSLEVSEVEVDSRLRRLFSRMGVRTAREATAECARRGLLSSGVSAALAASAALGHTILDGVPSGVSSSIPREALFISPDVE